MKIAMKMEIRPTEMPAARKKELPWGPSFAFFLAGPFSLMKARASSTLNLSSVLHWVLDFDFLEPFFPFDGPHTVVTAVAELLLALLCN
jgi:hypothetical protein